MGSLPFAKLRQQGRTKNIRTHSHHQYFHDHLPSGSFTAT